MTATAYPLSWPIGFPRTKIREPGAFKTSLPTALKNVQSSLRLFAADSRKKLDSIVISSNCTLGQDKPTDPAVAVWFIWDGMQVCIPVDRYNKVESNLQAIHHIIEARRVELRHGSLALVRATFTGLLALPHLPGEDWWTVLDIPSTSPRDVVEQAYKTARSRWHPDKPNGNAEKFDCVQKAWEQFQEHHP